MKTLVEALKGERGVVVTAQEIATALGWGDAKDLPPTETVVQVVTNGVGRWLYPDPTGVSSGIHPVTGEEVKGWPVRMLTGKEQLRVEVSQDKRVVEATPVEADEGWVSARIPARYTGRDARTLIKWLGEKSISEADAWYKSEYPDK